MSFEDTFKIFNIETEKLESTINTTLAKSELTIAEIVQIYYQIMNVNSFCTILKQQQEGTNEHDSLIRKIEKTQTLILEKFDLDLHPLIMSQLTNSITVATKKMQSKKTLEKSKDEIESEAKLFEKLRQIMSTKEFVEQYDKGLSHD
jgi:hypothetical protein